ncbi:MAG: hypothetical protein IJZ95_04200 [Oscillospiraceae bacterium]|nr:hypothetical protein [Oscillospiraceae bacterium]
MKKIRTILAVFSAFVMLTACSTPQDISSSEQTISDPFATTAPEFAETVEGKPPNIAAKEVLDALNGCSFDIDVVEPVNNTDNVMDYNGGSIDVSVRVSVENDSPVKPERVTIGIALSLNAIHQKISAKGSQPTEMYIHEFEYDPTTKEYISEVLELSFEPVIAEADKDMEQLRLAFTYVSNPHYRVTENYKSSGFQHQHLTPGGLKINVKTPITNYCDKKINTEYQKDLITDAIKEKYSRLRSSNNFDHTMSTAYDDLLNYDLVLQEDGKAKLGVVFTTGFSGTFRLFFIVNGAPATLSDGTGYMQIDAVPGYVYYFEPAELANVNAYDTINTVAICCDSNEKEFYAESATFASAILPHS